MKLSVFKAVNPPSETYPKSKARSRTATSAIAVLLLATGSQIVSGQSIFVPNFSFESPTAPSSFPFVNIFVDSWQKAPEPAYYGPAIGTPFGIPWIGTAGVFLDINPYANHDGTQAGYILGFPEVTLFQDYNSSPTHDFNATFEVGKSYSLTVGVYGKSTLAPGSTLQLSLYYLNESNNPVTLAATNIVYSNAAFPTNLPLNLIDYQVNVPPVKPIDAWAGKNIGIQLLSTTPIQLATGGNWDFDNVRLTAVPSTDADGDDDGGHGKGHHGHGHHGHGNDKD
jgi:hypothetical protein